MIDPRPICPWCLRPRADDRDDVIYEAVCNGDTRPDDWPDDEGTHLCWADAAGGECITPDWWDDITPLEVQELRQDRDRWKAIARAVTARVIRERNRAAIIRNMLGEKGRQDGGQ